MGVALHADHVHGLLQMFEPLLVLDAKALLLIHDHEAEIPELYVLGQQAVGADGDVHFAFRQIRQRRFEFLGCAKPAEHLGAHGEWLETPLEGLEVLKCQDCSRSENRHLLTVAQRFKGGAHHHLGLAKNPHRRTAGGPWVEGFPCRA